MGSLKDALEKAGFRSTKKQDKKKTYNNRPKKKIKVAGSIRTKAKLPEKTNTQRHQGYRNLCECCQRTFPDVEHYAHRNPTVDAHWLCSTCADKNNIPDSTRTTNQSEYAMKKIFRREYGPTKRFKNV
ncbi:MAG: hypothetical protein ISR65_06600 [Bacteriovoracaceae bacterium]|nr:hypothetical protein [Bacteriovoracaceae bacterium]